MYGLNQAGRGEKRNHESDSETESEDEQGQRYFERQSSRKYQSKKFGMTATDHKVRFNNVLADRDLLESIESTHKIFHYLLDEVTEGMNPKDQVRFILRSEQLDSPISLPFMPLETAYCRTGVCSNRKGCTIQSRLSFKRYGHY